MIDKVYSIDSLKTAFSTIQAELLKHYKTQQIEKGGLPWENPDLLKQKIQELMNLYQENSSFENKLQKISETFLQYSNRLHSTHYLGHQVASSIPLAALGELLGTMMNQATGIFEMSPFSATAERTMIEALIPYVGWKVGESDGILTHGGSLANLTALLSARNIQIPQSWSYGLQNEKLTPMIAVSREAHYCVKRSGAIMGLGEKNILTLETDSKRRIDPEKARAQILKARAEGNNVFCIVGTSGATPIGSFDPLHDLAAIAKEVGAWLHVDGAHGGGLLMSSKYRKLLSGIEKCDSLVWDAHKMMFVPALSTFVLYKTKEASYRALQQDAPYLFDKADQPTLEYDSAVRTMECTKRAMVMGVWTVWSVYGPKIFELMVDQVCQLSQKAYEYLNEQEDFEPLHEPECNILCFRFLSKRVGEDEQKRSLLQKLIRRQLLQDRKFYITATVLNGEHCLRVVFMNPQATEQDFKELCAEVRQIAKTLSET
ncbi:MAG: aspartate aminotransferase family protein [Bdellovibrionales bacterium]